MAEQYDTKKFQYIQGPDNEYHEFPVDMPDDQVDAEMATRYKDYQAPVEVPDVPLQPVPQTTPYPEGDWRNDPRVQADAAATVKLLEYDKSPWYHFDTPPSAEPTGPIEIPPAGTKGKRRGQLLPIEADYVTDETGKMVNTGDWNFAVPGIIHDIPQQIETLGSHQLGTEYTDDEIGSMLGLAGWGVGGDVIAGVGRGAKTFAPEKINRNTIYGELQGEISSRAAKEKGTPRATIFRQEVENIKKKYGKQMNQEQLNKLDDIVRRGDTMSRRAIEGVAGWKGLPIGFDVGLATIASSTLPIKPGVGIGIMGTRAAFGAGSKIVKGVAKAIRGNRLKKDLRDVKNTVTLRGKTGRVTTSSKIKAERVRDDFRDHPDTAVKSGRQPTEAEINATTTPDYVPPTQPRPTSPISLGGTKMNIGEPVRKTTGTDPRWLYDQQQKQQAAAARAEADKLRATPNAQPVPSGGTATPIPERFASGATSPIPKAADSTIQKLKERFFGGGGKVVKPLPKAKPSGGKVSPDETVKSSEIITHKQNVKKLAEAQKEMADVKKLPRGTDRDVMMDAIQKRIDSYEENIARATGQLPSQAKSVLSEAEHKAIVDTPPEYRSLEQKLEMAKKKYDDASQLEDSDARHWGRVDARVEIGELEAEIAKSRLTPEAKAAQERWVETQRLAAEAKKNARSPQSVLDEQKAIMDVEEAVASTVPKPEPVVKLMTTNAQRAAMRERGYTDDDMFTMSPTQIHNILSQTPRAAPKTTRVKKAEVAPPTEFEPVIKQSSKGVSLSGVAPKETVTTPKQPRVAKKSAARAERMTKTKRVTQTEARLAQRMADELATEEGVQGIADYVNSQKKGAPLELDVPAKPKRRSGKASGRGKRVY